MKSLTIVNKRYPKGTTSLVFLFFFLVMLCSSGGHLDVWDGKGYFLLTENLVKYHSLILHPDLLPPDSESGKGAFTIRNYFSWEYSLTHPGNCLFNCLPSNAKLEPIPSNGSPLLALIGVPFYIIADTIHYSTVKFTSYFVNPLILALMSTMVFVFASEFYKSKKIGFVLSLIAGVGSFAWPYVSGYLEQPLTALVLVTCLYFLFIASRDTHLTSQHVQRRIVRFSPVLAGFFLGLQSFAHPGTLIVVPGIAIIGAYILRNDKRKIIQFFAAFLLLVAFQLYINYLKFGSITEFGYGYTAAIGRHTFVEGLYGLIISPGFGLMMYFPLITLFPLVIYYLWRYNRVFCIAFLYVFFSMWAFYGTLEGDLWIGLGSWGPRYMITVIPLLAIASGSILKVISSTVTNKSIDESKQISSSSLNIAAPVYFKNILKGLFIVLAVSGFLINLLGVLVWYHIGFAYGFAALHVNQLADQAHYYKYFTWYPKYAPILLHWKVLTTNWWKNLRASDPTYLGWKTCIPDNFIYCSFGLVPSLALLIATISTGFFISQLLFERPLQIFGGSTRDMEIRSKPET